VVGWTLAPWLFGQGLYWPERLGWRQRFVRGAFTVSSDDLFEPQSLHLYIAAAKKHFKPGENYRLFNEWREELATLAEMTEPLPCSRCLLFSPQSNHGIRLAPSRWLHPGRGDTGQMRDHRKRLRKALKLVDKAKITRYGKSYRHRRAARRRQYKLLLRERRKNRRSR